MASKNLTDTYIRSLRAEGDVRLEISDGVRPGLRLRVYPNGTKKWVYEKRVKRGKKRKHDLGAYPHTTIKEARRIALEIQVESDAGVDRVQIRREQKEREAREAKDAVPLRSVLSSYHELHCKNLRSGDDVMVALWRALAPYLDDPARDVTHGMLQEAIDAKARTGAKVQANRLKAYLSHFSKFARRRGHFADGVGVELAKAVRETPREREMSIDEVRAVYTASYGMGDLWGPLIRLLVLTAQRKEEVAALRWSEVDFANAQLAIGGARTKNGKAHITHLSAPALAELEWLRSWADKETDLVFTTTGHSPPSGTSRMKKKLDGLLGDSVAPWRLHDLRTGFATVMCEAGEDEGVVDRILNHSATGSAPSAVARVYNRARLLPERKRVLDRWGRLVTEDREDNVVRIA